MDETPPETPEQAAARAAQREEFDNHGTSLLLGVLIDPADDCIDVGAHQGRFTQRMIDQAPDGRHYVFEPIPRFAAELRERFPKVEVQELALSDESGEAEFVYVPDDPGYSGLRERSYPADYRTERIPVRLARLDDVLPADFAPKVLKVDVEGAELQVFRGALRTLVEHRPYLFFEHGAGAADRYGTQPEDVWDLVCGEAGYRLYDFDGNGPYGREAFHGGFWGGRVWNWFGRPPGR